MNANDIPFGKLHREAVVDAVPLLLCLIDSEGRIIRCNRTLERWGLGPVASVEGRQLHEVLHPACTTPDCPLDEFLRAALINAAGNRRSQMEGFDPVLKRHLSVDFHPVSDDGDRALIGAQAVVSIDDVGTLRRCEHGVVCLQSSLRQCIGLEVARRQEAEEVRSRLLNLIGRTPNFVAIADAEGRLFYLNEAGHALLGVDEDAAPLSFADCLTPEARQALADEALPTAMREGVWRGASTLLARDGRRIPTTQVIIPNWGADGQSTGFSIVEQDMTAWVESETALRHSQEQLQRLSAELLEVQETERRRIAADLHDVIGQSLSLIKLSIEMATRLIDRGETAAARDSLKALGGKVKDALVEVQRVSMNLRPSTLDDLGILATLSWFFREFEATCSHIRVEKVFTVREEHIPPPIKTSIFRILQEATANIVKHAGADRMRVALCHLDNTIELTVEDNGQGFDPWHSHGRGGHGIGLRSMRERVRLSGGTYTIDSTIGQGTRIQVQWPATAAAEGR